LVRHPGRGAALGQRAEPRALRDVGSAAMRRALLCLALACLALAWPATSHAQVTMPALTITADPPGTLTVPSPEARRRELQKTPGAVEVVPSESFRDSRAQTVKDLLDFTPGVFAQHKFGEDSRLSIRGSGLSRNFHLRGLKLLQDGVPINLADG